MNKYNYCQKCGQWMGWKSWFKFWEQRTTCQECERRQL